MPLKKPLNFNTYAFLPDMRLLLILAISPAYFLLAAGCAQNLLAHGVRVSFDHHFVERVFRLQPFPAQEHYCRSEEQPFKATAAGIADEPAFCVQLA